MIHLRAFIHLVGVSPAVFTNPDNNAYDTLSVQSIGADCDPEPLLVKAEMWLRILRTSMCGNHGNWDDRISQLYNIVNSALPIRVLPL